MPHPAEGERRPPDYRHYLAAFELARQRYRQEPTPHNREVLLAGELILYRELEKPGRFDLGQLVMTPGAGKAMRADGHIPPEFLLRHKHGDYGELDEEDRHANDQALVYGSRLFSSYTTRLNERLWVITESDRSVTTLLLPQDY
jgi:hypothetical protein